MAKERFFNLPVLILIASSFMLGMSEFIVVGILPDIAADLKISEVTVGNLVAAGPESPVLTRLVSVNPIYASFNANETVVARATNRRTASDCS